MDKDSIDGLLVTIIVSILAGTLVISILTVLGLKLTYTNIQLVKERAMYYEAENKTNRIAEETKHWKVVFKDGTEHQFDGVFADVMCLWRQVDEVPVYISSIPKQQTTGKQDN